MTTGRKPVHLPRIAKYLETKDGNGVGVRVKELAYALDLTTSQVSAAIGNHVKSTGPNAQVARIKMGLFRWVSPAERQRMVGRARKATTLKKIVDAAKVQVPATTGNVVSSTGWVAPDPSLMDLMPNISVERGGTQITPPLAVGLAVVGEIVHIDRGVTGLLPDVYFTWRGKMWKATTV